MGFDRFDFVPDNPARACWDYVRAVHSEDLPLYPTFHRKHAGPDEIEPLIGSAWQEVAPADRRSGDVAWFRESGTATHVGLLVSRWEFIHYKKDGARTNKLTEEPWSSYLVGVYRYKGVE